MAMKDLYTLLSSVREAVETYDASGDHATHNASERDCYRCAIVRALPDLMRDKLNARERIYRTHMQRTR